MKKTKSLMKLSAAALCVLHCVNKIIDSASIINNTTKSNGKYYHWTHGDLYYRVTGQGKPLLLIHDLTVFSSHHEWSQLVHELSKRYKVYTLDLIGCGKSDKPSITYTSYFYVLLISDFVKNVIKDSCFVVSTGLSSSFVLMTDYLHKDLFDSVMLISPKSVSELRQGPDDRSKFLSGLFELPVLGKTAYYFVTNKANTEYYLSEKCFYNPFHLKQSVIKAYYDASHTGNGNGKYLLSSLAGHYLNTNITQALKEAKKPVILVGGAQNKAFENIAASYQKYNNQLMIRSVSGANYLPQLETPEELLDLLIASFSD